MTIQQEAIMRARIALIKAKEVLKAAQDFNKCCDEMWDWAEGKECIFNDKQLEEYQRLYNELETTLEKAEEEIKK